MFELPIGEVFLFPLNEGWEKEFIVEIEKIKIAIGFKIIRHNGSTSIRHLSGKLLLLLHKK